VTSHVCGVSINIPFWMRFNCRGDRRSPILNDDDDYARITVPPIDSFTRLRLCVSRSSRSPLQSGSTKRSLGAFVGGFKSAITKRIGELRGLPRTPVWQRNYYEHVVRNEGSLHRIRQYIGDNPARWEFDQENPLAMQPESADAWR
jgi:REP element-mobilizing transposase RayT